MNEYEVRVIRTVEETYFVEAENRETALANWHEGTPGESNPGTFIGAEVISVTEDV